MKFEDVTYPAFFKKDGHEYGLHFPTLLPDYGWEIPICTGLTKKEVIQHGKKRLTFLIAGRLHDNEELPSQEPIPIHLRTEDMELIFLKTAFNKFAKELEEHLPWRHWHIYFNRDDSSDFQAVAYKNKQGLWKVVVDGELPVNIQLDKLLHLCPTYPVICTVRRRVEAEEVFDQFVRDLKEISKLEIEEGKKTSFLDNDLDKD